MRGATRQRPGLCLSPRNFNPRTPCGVRPAEMQAVYDYLHISIHAPRAGCDPRNLRLLDKVMRFQSTHPVRGATDICTFFLPPFFISIHAPRAGCDQNISKKGVKINISIHAPRAGCDGAGAGTDQRPPPFQSTHPVRGATANLTVLPGQICTKGTKKSLFSRKNAQKRK